MMSSLDVIIPESMAIAYGTLLGALIAYVHIPPWIATLAGYLSFRGLGTSILSSNSTTGSLAPFPDDFRNLFYGRVFPNTKGELNLPCFILGLAAAAILALFASPLIISTCLMSTPGIFTASLSSKSGFADNLEIACLIAS